MELIKNDVVELTVESLGINGEGVARVEGKTVFIKNVLPAEKIRAKIIAVKPRFNFALVEKIIESSPYRVSPPCPQFGKCGGCDLMHLDYDQQLIFKRNKVKDTLYHVGGIDVEVDDVVASKNQLRYRNKISLPVRADKDGGIKVGLFAKGSHRVVETTDCLLQFAWNAPLITAVKEFIKEKGYRGYCDESGKGDVRHVVARQVGDKVIVALVCTKKIDVKLFADKLANFLDKFDLYVNVNRRHDNVILGDEWHFAFGKGESVVVDGLKTQVHPASFFQVNDDVREKLYSDVAMLCKGKYAVEAFSGAGLLSARLAKSAEKVYGIEINEQAHESALKLKSDNGIENTVPVLGDVSDKIDQVIAKCGKDPFIVLDPPRTGVSESALGAIAKSGASGIVYVSCNPATLARDLKILVGYGYFPTKVTPYDMFPQTCNVETLVVLSHKKAGKA